MNVRSTTPGLAAATLAALVFAGCSANHSRTASDVLACTEPTGALDAAATLEGRAGEYALTMIASGEVGQEASGRLSLHMQQGEFRQMPGVGGTMLADVTVPLYGTSNIDLDAVGAIKLGDLESDDPSSPGVLVLEQKTADANNITIRMGSFANQRGVVRFDGGFTALTVTTVGEGTFGGTWASGVQGPEASGYFCAVAR